MLSREHRLVSSEQFARTVRRGRRGGSGTVVLHLTVSEPSGAGPAQVGFVVSKAVGSAVTRNLVKRRLRQLARERLSSLPGSAALVVRALPASGSASYERLADDFDTALSTVLRRVERGSELP